MTEKRKVKVVYRRWTILVPILLMVIGSILLFVFWMSNAVVALLGGMLMLIGVLALGILLAMIISLELGTRALRAQRPVPPPLSEDFGEEDQENS
ncbi:MAG: hypothetical protein ACFE9D_06845 [Promethearchaeota archaeon]